MTTDIVEQMQQAEELALDVLRLSRNTLMIHLRFLGAALMQFVPGGKEVTPELATDGQYLYYNPWHVLRSYRKGREIPARDYLHTVLHCVFRHLFFGGKVKGHVWDLACDVAVENAINDLCLRAVSCPRQERQKELLGQWREELGVLNAEKLYRYFLDKDLPAEEYEYLRSFFYADDHRLWHEEHEARDADTEKDTESVSNESGDDPAQTQSSEDQMPPPEEGEEEESEGAGQFTGESADSGEGDSATGGEEERKGDQPQMARDELEQLWKEISERVQVDLETSSNMWGEAGGGMMQELKAVNRERYDYAGFLRRFAVLGENIEVSDEEFDYILYTYGLKMFKNMPLVEPLEYKEVKRVREFVIALDTSQSVSGDLVQSFVNKTYNILKQTDNFFTKMNIHIIQCGASIQEDALITSEAEFDAYIQSMALYGFGGTDFRPVFTYVDKLVENGAFANFKGLIYFTDGYGTFPERKPDYDTAFVFVNEGEDTPEVPVWAIKLVLSPEEVESL